MFCFGGGATLCDRGVGVRTRASSVKWNCCQSHCHCCTEYSTVYTTVLVRYTALYRRHRLAVLLESGGNLVCKVV